MKVCIVGLGAVGGYVGARLANAGLEVSALARGATLEAVRRDGLVLVEGDSRTTAPIFASDDPADLGTPDLIVLSVKTPSLPSVAPALAQLIGPSTTVLSMTNGVPWWFFDGLPIDKPDVPSLDPGGVMTAAVPSSAVLGSVTHLSASTPSPGVVEARFFERIVVGEPSGGDADGRAAAVADLLRRGGFAVGVSERIQRDVWFKLWGNMTMNPLSAITGATMDVLLADPDVRAFASRCMTEAAAVGSAIGIDVGITPEERHTVTRRLGAARTSMLQDVDAGRPVELDALVAVVVEMGRSLGVPTPDLETLLGLSRVHAQVRGLYRQ